MESRSYYQKIVKKYVIVSIELSANGTSTRHKLIFHIYLNMSEICYKFTDLDFSYNRPEKYYEKHKQQM